MLRISTGRLFISFVIFTVYEMRSTYKKIVRLNVLFPESGVLVPGSNELNCRNTGPLRARAGSGS